MKRRRRKRKAKQEAKAAEPVMITREPETQVLVQAETEEQVMLQGEAEEPVIIPSEPEEQIIVENKTEERVIIQGANGQAASAVEFAEIEVELENVESPVELQDELESFASAVEVLEESEKSAVPVEEPVAKKRPAPEPVGQTEADRRTHPRYAFTAAAEVAAEKAGARIKTRVRDLSQQGCYVDTDSPLALGTTTDVRISKGGKSFEARARVVYIQPGKGMGLMFTEVEAEQRETLELWIAESRETSWLAANRRRSQRVLMKIPVRVTGQLGAGLAFEEDTFTLAINAHGALIVVAAPVYRGQRFTLSNTQTKAALECVVVHVDRMQGGQIHVGVDFMLPNSTFWRVAFPPKDWTPRHPDAKKG